MDLIQNSHMERIKKHLEENPGHELRAKKVVGSWRIRIANQGDYDVFTVLAPSLGDGLKQVSEWIYTK